MLARLAFRTQSIGCTEKIRGNRRRTARTRTTIARTGPTLVSVQKIPATCCSTAASAVGSASASIPIDLCSLRELLAFVPFQCKQLCIHATAFLLVTLPSILFTMWTNVRLCVHVFQRLSIPKICLWVGKHHAMREILLGQKCLYAHKPSFMRSNLLFSASICPLAYSSTELLK